MLQNVVREGSCASQYVRHLAIREAFQCNTLLLGLHRAIPKGWTWKNNSFGFWAISKVTKLIYLTRGPKLLAKAETKTLTLEKEITLLPALKELSVAAEWVFGQGIWQHQSLKAPIVRREG